MAGIQYNKMMYGQAAVDAKSSKILMDETIDSAAAVSSADIPASFSAATELNDQIKDITEVCGTGDIVVSVFDDWNQTLALLEESGNLDGISWGSYINFDDSLLLYVDGNPYPIDQYVMGVLDGEHQAMKAYSEYYHGTMTYNQMLEFLKAFAVMARSYGLAQTIYSDYNGGIHKIDHVIENGSTKQCFNTRLFVNTGQYADWVGAASVAARASVETTGMVLAQNGEAISMYYAGSKSEKVFTLAKQNLNYKEIIDVIYAPEIAAGAKLSYVDYKTEKIIGEVPTSEMTSSLANVNLSGNAVVKVPFVSGDRSAATVYTGDTGDSAERINNLKNSYGPESANYRSVSSGTSSGGGTRITVNSSINQQSGPIIRSELPTTKFKNDVPVTTFGNKVTIVEDTLKSVEYKIDNIDMNAYNDFTKSLKEQGYVLSSNGDTWKNSNTMVKLIYDTVNKSIKLKVYDITEM